MAEPQKFYITTAISYPNGVPHIGHAYEAIATDAIARFERLDGKDVLFLTGTDEHGLKMKQTAVKEGLTPRALADRNSARFREMAAALACPTTTSSAPPSRATTRPASELWRRMEAAGDIYLSKYAGWYSVRDEAFYRERRDRASATDGVRIAKPHRARRSSGSRRRPTSSGCRSIRTSCSPTTPPTPISSCRPSGATRS